MGYMQAELCLLFARDIREALGSVISSSSASDGPQSSRDPFGDSVTYAAQVTRSY